MITSLKIKNMRGFKEFSMQNAGQITLVSGENNVGKSTILEGIYLLLSYNKPELFLMLNAMRGVQVTSFSPALLWEPLFHDTKMSEELSVSCLVASEGRSVTLTKDEQFSALHRNNKQIPVAGLPTFQIQPNLQIIEGGYPLKIKYEDKNIQTTGYCLPEINGLSIQWDTPAQAPQPYVHFIGSRVFEHGNNTAQLLGKAELAGTKKLLVEALQMLDASVEDISTIMLNNNGYLYSKRNDGLHLPLSAMGDGANRLLMILCAMAANPGCILLIDEIENGFHYSFYPKLWKAIENAAISTKSQIFATTHSYECIQGAVDGLLKENPTNDVLRYIRLNRHNGQIEPHNFSAESLNLAIANNMEIR